MNKYEKLLLNMKKGSHEQDKSINKINAKKVYIESPKQIKCNIDGEILEDNKFNIEVIPKGIEIYFNSKLIDELLKLNI